MMRAPFEIDNYYHIYNRGVDKRPVFMEERDLRRFLLYLQVLNDTEIQSPNSEAELLGRSLSIPKKRLLDIVAFCLMTNHFHLLLHERIEGGISKFMQRLGTAYTMYFNERLCRQGALFQGVYRSRLVDSEAYLGKVINYIHLNPRKLMQLDKYPWSSYHDYCGVNRYMNILNTKIVEDFMPRSSDYEQYLKEQNNFSEVEHISIDHKDTH